MGEVAIELAAPEQRRYRSEELGLLWRDATGPIPEAVAVDSSLSRWSGGGSDVDVQLAGADLGRLRAAAEEVKQRLRGVRWRLRGDRLVPGRQGGDEARHQARR